MLHKLPDLRHLRDNVMRFSKQVWAERLSSSSEIDFITGSETGEVFQLLADLAKIEIFRIRYDADIDGTNLDNFVIYTRFNRREYQLVNKEIESDDDRYMRLTFQQVSTGGGT